MCLFVCLFFLLFCVDMEIHLLFVIEIYLLLCVCVCVCVCVCSSYQCILYFLYSHPSFFSLIHYLPLSSLFFLSYPLPSSLIPLTLPSPPLKHLQLRPVSLIPSYPSTTHPPYAPSSTYVLSFPSTYSTSHSIPNTCHFIPTHPLHSQYIPLHP